MRYSLVSAQHVVRSLFLCRRLVQALRGAQPGVSRGLGAGEPSQWLRFSDEASPLQLDEAGCGISMRTPWQASRPNESSKIELGKGAPGGRSTICRIDLNKKHVWRSATPKNAGANISKTEVRGVTLGHGHATMPRICVAMGGIACSLTSPAKLGPKGYLNGVI